MKRIDGVKRTDSLNTHTHTHTHTHVLSRREATDVVSFSKGGVNL